MRLGAVMLLLAVAVGACGEDTRREVLVSAAASLTDAFAAVETGFEAEHPDVDVVLNLGGSSLLREQILSGAPVDVFASASESIMDEVVAAGLVFPEEIVFATNRLSVVVPAGNPAGIADIGDLDRDDLLIGLCAQAVPCGSLAEMALARAGVVASPDTLESDVRSLLTKIGAGELDVGIVYVTDIVASRGAVEAIPIAPEHNVTATYHIGLLSGAENPSDAARFVDYVVSPEGRALLASFGFGSP